MDGSVRLPSLPGDVRAVVWGASRTLPVGRLSGWRGSMRPIYLLQSETAASALARCPCGRAVPATVPDRVGKRPAFAAGRLGDGRRLPSYRRWAGHTTG